MPPLFAGRRRRGMSLLVLCSLVHAACAVGSALLVGQMLGNGVAGTGPSGTWILMAAAGACLAGMGLTRYGERVLAERVGQDYVHQLRRGLVESSMVSATAPSLGITIARSTNDLTSVRTWVAQGILPLVAAVPLIAGSLAMLWALDWRLAIAVAAPLALLGLVLAALAGKAYERARELRRRRGSLAARIADTVQAAEGIVAGGGLERELRQIDRVGGRVVAAAVRRARLAAAMRAVALTASAAAAAAVAATGAFGWVGPAAVAAGLTVVGVLASPVTDLGRVVEFRQNYKAARRIIAPLLEQAAARSAVAGVSPSPPGRKDGKVLIRDLALHGTSVPPLQAEPGERIAVESTSPERVRSLFHALASPRHGGPFAARIDGADLAAAEPAIRRRLVGYAFGGAVLERGTVARAVRYRRPGLPDSAVLQALRDVGLADRVAALPDGVRTVLKRGGEPLDRGERARLLLARATLGEPPLLLLDRIDADLGSAGTALLRVLVEAYPGVVVFASEQPDAVVAGYRRWIIDGPCAHGG